MTSQNIITETAAAIRTRQRAAALAASWVPLEAVALLCLAIRQRRKAMGITQAELGRRARCGVRVVNEVENLRRWNVSASTIFALATAAGLQLAMRPNPNPQPDRPTP